MLKTVVLRNIFVETMIIFFRILWIDSLKEHLFEIEIFCNIINVFVTFGQFNASLLNKY